MKSLFNGAGYYINDDRASGGKVSEDDILSCSHCQALLKRHEWQNDGAFCNECGAPICKLCYSRVQTHGCEVFTRQIERALNRRYIQDQNARLFGV